METVRELFAVPRAASPGGPTNTSGLPQPHPRPPAADVCVFEPWNLDALPNSLTERFRQVAFRRGDATALIDRDQRRSYRDVLMAASHIGLVLAANVKTAGPVALHLGGSDAIVALLGVLFAGRPYVCVPPDLDDSRMPEFIDAARPSAIIGDATVTRQLVSTPGCESVPVFALHVIERVDAPAPLAHRPTADAAACLFLTFPVDRPPETMAMSHRAVLFDIGGYVNDLQLGASDRFELHVDPSCSTSLAPLFSALLTGGALRLCHRRTPRATLGGFADAASLGPSAGVPSSLDTQLRRVMSALRRAARLFSGGLAEPV